jgi:hypothetical protein
MRCRNATRIPQCGPNSVEKLGSARVCLGKHCGEQLRCGSHRTIQLPLAQRQRLPVESWESIFHKRRTAPASPIRSVFSRHAVDKAKRRRTKKTALSLAGAARRPCPVHCGNTAEVPHFKKLAPLFRAMECCTRCDLARTNAGRAESVPIGGCHADRRRTGKQEDEQGKPFVGSAGRMLIACSSARASSGTACSSATSSLADRPEIALPK